MKEKVENTILTAQELINPMTPIKPKAIINKLKIFVKNIPLRIMQAITFTYYSVVVMLALKGLSLFWNLLF